MDQRMGVRLGYFFSILIFFQTSLVFGVNGRTNLPPAKNLVLAAMGENTRMQAATLNQIKDKQGQLKQQTDERNNSQQELNKLTADTSEEHGEDIRDLENDIEKKDGEIKSSQKDLDKLTGDLKKLQAQQEGLRQTLQSIDRNLVALGANRGCGNGCGGAGKSGGGNGGGKGGGGGPGALAALGLGAAALAGAGAAAAGAAKGDKSNPTAGFTVPTPPSNLPAPLSAQIANPADAATSGDSILSAIRALASSSMVTSSAATPSLPPLPNSTSPLVSSAISLPSKSFVPTSSPMTPATVPSASNQPRQRLLQAAKKAPL